MTRTPKERFVAILTQWDDGEHTPENINRLADFLLDAIAPSACTWHNDERVWPSRGERG